MSDYHAELERHLREAARRQARWGRFGLPARPRGGLVLAMAATAAVVAVAFVVALSSVGGDAEREVTAPGPSGGSCDLAELRAAFGVLRSPAQPGETLGMEALTGRDVPRKVFEDASREVSSQKGLKLWAVPICDSQGRPAVCLVDIDGDVQRSCGTEGEARDGRVFLSGPLGGRNYFHAVLVPDDITEVGVKVGDTEVGGSVSDNLLWVGYDASLKAFENAQVLPKAGQNLHSPDTRDTERCAQQGATQDPAPSTIVDRIAALRRPPGPATDFELEEPEVRTIYAASTRIARFGSAAEAFVVPVELGECEEPRPGVCLAPAARGFEAACGTLPEADSDPFVLAMTRTEAGETDVIGVTSDDVRAVDVTYRLADGSTTSLRVETEAGTFTATVAEAEGGVSVEPAD